jgi:hypothetical protein
LVIAVSQLSWIAFTPITGDAAAFYGVDDPAIGLPAPASVVFTVVVSILAVWGIDSAEFGAAWGSVPCSGALSPLCGLSTASYTWVLVRQAGIAVGQLAHREPSFD